MSFLARFMATFWRTCCALLAIVAVALAEVPGDREFFECWAVSGVSALAVGLLAAAVIGTVRLLLGAPPGSAKDPRSSRRLR